MKAFNRIRPLTDAERAALVGGTKAKAGFTMRRSQMLLLSAEGFTPQQIAQRLHGGDQTVRNVIRAFEREGLGCLHEKSHRPHHLTPAFDAQGLEQLEELVHRSPRDFGLETSLWSLKLLAQVCVQQRIVKRAISDETVRRGLRRLGIDWRQARQTITSHDPHYALKKTAAALDRLG